MKFTNKILNLFGWELCLTMPTTYFLDHGFAGLVVETKRDWIIAKVGHALVIDSHSKELNHMPFHDVNKKKYIVIGEVGVEGKLQD